MLVCVLNDQRGPRHLVVRCVMRLIGRAKLDDLLLCLWRRQLLR